MTRTVKDAGKDLAARAIARQMCRNGVASFVAYLDLDAAVEMAARIMVRYGLDVTDSEVTDEVIDQANALRGGNVMTLTMAPTSSAPSEDGGSCLRPIPSDEPRRPAMTFTMGLRPACIPDEPLREVGVAPNTADPTPDLTTSG